jgi:hypothetical protein
LLHEKNIAVIAIGDPLPDLLPDRGHDDLRNAD